MKIIYRGEAPDLYPFRFECNYCRTVFEATRQEATFVPDLRDGSCMQHACPVCNRPCTSAVKNC